MYEGQYYKDKKHGFGIFKWATGNIYRGQYKADEREGIGEMKWTDGSIYIGEWVAGIQHGYGRMYFPDGTVKEGLFDSNVHKGVAEEVPCELRSVEFDVMTLAPQGLPFSKEITTFFPASYQQSKLSNRTSTRFFLRNSSSKKARYLGPALATQSSCRTQNFGGETFSASQSSSQKGNVSRMVTPGKDQNSRPRTIYSNFNRNLSSKKMRRTPLKESDLYHSLARGSSSAKLRKKSSKKVWKPAGIVHYKDSVLFTRNHM
eukprot:TRINITY_DN9560_c0_g1_i1.p1 TRINITY_DN9560_c0_g1~~TRINITY_DN9560_c0_g1_i1.p1  ORF type:complete len:260 (+),score=48.02 TRINITY_DN9560_c0_g1_i1:250-1029(+)